MLNLLKYVAILFSAFFLTSTMMILEIDPIVIVIIMLFIIVSLNKLETLIKGE